MVTSRIRLTAAQQAELWEAMERAKCCGHLRGAGKEEQDRRRADRGPAWRDRARRRAESLEHEGRGTRRRSSVALRWSIDPADRPGPRTGAIEQEAGRSGATAQVGRSWKPGDRRAGSGRRAASSPFCAV